MYASKNAEAGVYLPGYHHAYELELKPDSIVDMHMKIRPTTRLCHFPSLSLSIYIYIYIICISVRISIMLTHKEPCHLSLRKVISNPYQGLTMLQAVTVCRPSVIVSLFFEAFVMFKIDTVMHMMIIIFD